MTANREGLAMTQLIEPAREVPVRREADVLTCGGGCAGAIAALAAAYPEIRRSLTAKSSATGEAAIGGTASPQSSAPVRRLLDALSFTHFAELIAIDDPLKRAFYEVECIRGNWSVRQLGGGT